MPFAATWMQLESIILSEVSQKGRYKYHMISLNVASKIRHKQTYLQNINRLIDIENRLVVAKAEGGREREGLGVGVGRCKLLHLECINSKVLLYSTELYPISWDKPQWKI